MTCIVQSRSCPCGQIDAGRRQQAAGLADVAGPGPNVDMQGASSLRGVRPGKTLTTPRYGGVLVGPSFLRQVFNDTESEVLWLIVGAPDKEFESGKVDLRQFYPVEPTQLPVELEDVAWPSKE